MLEGLAPSDRHAWSTACSTDGGLFLIPPDIRSNTQRLFLPRHLLHRSPGRRGHYDPFQDCALHSGTRARENFAAVSLS